MFAAIWRRRMVRKGPAPRLGEQEPAVGPLDLPSEAVRAKRQVYLVIFPHPRGGSGLVAPTSLTRAEILTKLLQACAAPSSGSPDRRTHQPVTLEFAAVFHELHKENRMLASRDGWRSFFRTGIFAGAENTQHVHMAPGTYT